MKAVVFHKPGHVQVDQVPDPKIEYDEDIIVRVTSTAICGSDLHIFNGFIPQKNEMVMGHEFTRIVEGRGRGVAAVQKGDRVVAPVPIACGSCFFCAGGLPGHCENSNPEKYGPEGGLLDEKGGGLFGYTVLDRRTRGELRVGPEFENGGRENVCSRMAQALDVAHLGALLEGFPFVSHGSERFLDFARNDKRKVTRWS